MDLYVANGRVGKFRPQFLEDDPHAEPDQVYQGLKGARFEEVKPQGGTTEPYYATGRGMSFVDVDNDGDLDVVVGNNRSKVRLLENVTPDQGRSALIDVRDERGAPAVGALVTVQAG